ncbi:MAG: flavin monoamine oxidase family protein [Acidimicrobiales bacterium]
MSDRKSPLRASGDSAEDGTYFRLADGNQALATAIAERVGVVRLDHRVTSVTQDETDVRVRSTTGSGTYETTADAVVVAVPANQLHTIEFGPSLPQQMSLAASKIRFGEAAKLAVGLVEPPSLRARHDTTRHYWSWTGKGGDGRVRKAVTAFCGSSEAQQKLAIGSSGASTWLDQLRRANPDLNLDGDTSFHDWSADPWSQGCYSAFDLDAAESRSELSAPVGRLTFAGEHTSRESATMEGALASGLRAAEQVKAILPTSRPAASKN